MGLFTPCAQKSIRRCLVLSHLTRNAGKAVTMSGGLDVLQMKEEDVLKFLAASTHLGGTNMDFQMEQYVYKRKTDGVYIINLRKTWEKLLLAARAIVAIENPADVCVISSRNTGQRAVLKFASATGASTFQGRFPLEPSPSPGNTPGRSCLISTSTGFHLCPSSSSLLRL